jgi:AcrR family transcriptional regulator
VGRQRQPEIRARLLDGCTRYLLEHGLPVTSLRPLAEALNTSPRMLIYHFATKDRLVHDALIEARRRQRQLFDGALRHQPGRDYADTLSAAWSTIAGEQAYQYVRLFAAVHALPPDEAPWRTFPVMAVHDWLPILEDGLAQGGYAQPQALATLTLAVARGLLLDTRATAERERAKLAYEAFIVMLRSQRAGTSAPPAEPEKTRVR